VAPGGQATGRLRPSGAPPTVSAVQASAAVFDGERLIVVDDLEVPPPGTGEVTVRVLASGICHSDLNVIDGARPVPPPVVLGHEGAGVVEALGPEVEGWAVGDEVVLHGLTPCGSCRSCRHGHPTACADAFGRGATPFRLHGAPVRSYANVSSFSERTTVRAAQLVRAEGLSPLTGCLLGCAVSTGVGVVRNVAGVVAGDRVAVIGVGGIGTNAIRAAALAGATVTAVDLEPGRELLARGRGADRFVTAGATAALAGGFDVVVECSGAPTAIESALVLTAPGGTTALVGLPPVGATVPLDVGALMAGRRVVGSLNGDTLPERDLPLLVDLARDGVLGLDELVSGVWPLEAVGEAVAAVRAGDVVRAVLDLSDGRRQADR
jgi:S-(hydroxymethyl)glutathione dehydrogenase / alcohol dehydrogenase